jgi:hypothetical protein
MSSERPLPFRHQRCEKCHPVLFSKLKTPGTLISRPNTGGSRRDRFYIVEPVKVCNTAVNRPKMMGGFFATGSVLTTTRKKLLQAWLHFCP